MSYFLKSLPLSLLCCTTMLFAQTEEVLTAADWMPYFANCEKGYKEKSNEKRACSDANLAYYLTQNLVFPDSAKQKGVRGTVYVSFVVHTSGKVTDVKLLNDIGAGCGDVAKRVVSQMPNWEAAEHKNKKVNIQLTLPIKFEIDEGEEAQKNAKIYWGEARYDIISLSHLSSFVHQKVLVRDEKGEFYPILKLTLTYENGKKFKQKSTKSEKISDEMAKIMKKAKPGGTLTISTTLQKKGTFFELHRSFSLIP